MGSHKNVPLVYSTYSGEHQLQEVIQLIDKDLSEPYSIFTYRYFLYNWPELCLLAYSNSKLVGVIICRREEIGIATPIGSAINEPALKIPRIAISDVNPDHIASIHWRGYIAMLAVEKEFRGNGIGTELAKRAIAAMTANNCEEVMLETEITNKGALRLYENLGFCREERLVKYYLNGGDAFRLKLWLV